MGLLINTGGKWQDMRKSLGTKILSYKMYLMFDAVSTGPLPCKIRQSYNIPVVITHQGFFYQEGDGGCITCMHTEHVYTTMQSLLYMGEPHNNYRCLQHKSCNRWLCPQIKLYMKKYQCDTMHYVFAPMQNEYPNVVTRLAMESPETASKVANAISIIIIIIFTHANIYNR